MPKEEWGVKRVCPKTQKRFYDLGRDPIVSPYTGEVVTVDSNAKTHAVVNESAEAKPDEAELVDHDDILVEDDQDDDTVSLDEIADVSNEDHDD